jgi:hypothetical protein
MGIKVTVKDGLFRCAYKIIKMLEDKLMIYFYDDYKKSMK